jgi:hypothetical protein
MSIANLNSARAVDFDVGDPSIWASVSALTEAIGASRDSNDPIWVAVDALYSTLRDAQVDATSMWNQLEQYERITNDLTERLIFMNKVISSWVVMLGRIEELAAEGDLTTIGEMARTALDQRQPSQLLQ